MVALAEQIVAFRQQLPKLRQAHGSAWAVFVNSQCKGAFLNFESAAEFALRNFPSDEYLIRHTDEQRETIPFVVIDN